jgi:RNA polymerase sigma-70 factor (ECF subfamily)
MDAVRLNDKLPERVVVLDDTGNLGESDHTYLIDKARNGDFDAYGELYDIYLNRIYKYVFYQVRDKMTAEDLTQEIFMKAWKALTTYKGKGLTFSAWLYRIANNHVIDHFRANKRKRNLDKQLAANIEMKEHNPEAQQIQNDLLRAISSLPPEQKQLIILKFVEDLDNKEIEHIMHKGQGAIRIMQMRALASLRKKLIGEMDYAV